MGNSIDRTYFDWIMYSTRGGEFSDFSELQFERHLERLRANSNLDNDDVFIEQQWYRNRLYNLI